MKGKQQDFRTEKYIRYGIRKYSFGAASVAIAAGLMFLGNGAVSATEVEGANELSSTATPTPTIGDEGANQDANSSKPNTYGAEPVLTRDGGEDTASSQPSAENTEAVATSSSAEIVADKAGLKAIVSELELRLSKINRTKVPASTIANAEKVLEDAKRILAKENASQLEVNEIAKASRSQASIIASMPKVLGETPAAVENKVEAAPATPTATEAEKRVEAANAELATVQEDLARYLPQAEKLATDSVVIESAKATLQLIKSSLVDANITIPELEKRVQEAKRVRNSLVNLVTGSNSGSRDSRNGQAMKEGSQLLTASDYISTPNENGTYTTIAHSPTKENHTGKDIYEFNATAAKSGDLTTDRIVGNITSLEAVVYSNQRLGEETNPGNAGGGVNNKGRMDYPLTKEQEEALAEEAKLWKGKTRIDGSTISGGNNDIYKANGGYEYLATHIYHYAYEQGQDRVYIDKIKERFDLTDAAKKAGWVISNVAPENLPSGLKYNPDTDTIEGKITVSNLADGVYDTRTYVTYTNTKTKASVRAFYRNLRGGWIGWQDTTPPTIESNNTVHKGTVGEEIAPVDIHYNDKSGSRITTERGKVSYTLANGTDISIRLSYGNGTSGISGNISTNSSTVDTAIPGLTYKPNAGTTPIIEDGKTVGYDGKGLISGTPTKAGVYHVTAYAKDFNRTDRASGVSSSWNLDTQEGRGELTFVIAPKVTVKNIATYDSTVPVEISDGATYAEITTPDGSKTILKTKAGKWVVQEGTTNTAVSVGAEVGTVGTEFSLSVKPEATATAGVSKISAYAKTEDVTANLMRTKVELNSATNGQKYTAVLNPKSGRYELAASDAEVRTELNDGNGNYTITKREVSTRAQTDGSMKFDLYEYKRTYNNANKVTTVNDVTLTETVYNKEDTANTATGNGMYITVQYDKNSNEWSASDKSTVKAHKTGDDTWEIETSSGYTGTVKGIMAENTSTSTIINSKPTAASTSYESTLNTTVNLIDRSAADTAVVTSAKVSVSDAEDNKLAESNAEDAFKESHKTKVTSITVTDPDGNTVFASTTSGDAANYPAETSLKLTKVGVYRVTVNAVDSNTNLVDGTNVGDTTAGTDHGVNTSTATTTYTITVKAGIEGTPETTSDIQGAVQKGTPSFNFDDAEKTKISSTTNGTKVYSLESTNATDNTGATVGTYAINADTGEVTFTPNPTFVGTPNPAKVKLTVTVAGVDPLTSTADYTPTVIGVRPEGTKASSTDIQGQVQTGKPTFIPGSAEVNGARKTVPLKADSYKLLDSAGTEVADGATTPAYAAADNGTVKAGDVIGTFGIDKSTGLVTFTPTNKAYVGAVKPVQVLVSDNNGTQPENDKRGEYTPNIVGVTPTASEASTTGIQGAVQKSEVVLNAKDENVNTLNFSKGSEIVNGTEKSVDLNEATLTLVGADGEGKVSVAGQGTYSIVKEDGKSYVQFTPVATYTGNVTPVTVKIADANGTEVTTIYTPKIVGVKPSAESSKTNGIQGETQTSAIKFDAADTDDTTVNFAKGTAIINSESKSVELDKTSVKLVDAENGTVNGDGSVTVANQGTYKLVKDETGAIAVTFTPLATFTGEAHAVTVSITDANGTEATTTYTPTVVSVAPTAKESATVGKQGQAQTSQIVFDTPDTDATTLNFAKGETSEVLGEDGQPKSVALDKSTLTLLDANGNSVTTVKVDGEGTYTLDKTTNAITFQPTEEFTGKATPVRVQIADIKGTTVTTTYTPTVTPVTPTGVNTGSAGPKNTPQSGTPTFVPGHKDVPMDNTVPATFEDGTTSKTVPNEGTYTVDATGKVTFTPNKDFVGTATGVTIVRKDTNGTVAKAKYTPTVYEVKSDTQVATVTYKDTKGTILGEVDILQGDSGSEMNYSTAERINALKKLGYELVSDEFTKADGSKQSFDNDTNAIQKFVVTVQPRLVPVIPSDVTPVPGQPINPEDPNSPVWPESVKELTTSEEVTRTITYVDGDGKEVTTSVTSSVKFTRDAKVNLVTGEVTYGEWKAATTDVLSGNKLPLVKGYIAVSGDIEASTKDQTVKAEDKDIVQKVVYKKLGALIPNVPGQTNPPRIDYPNDPNGDPTKPGVPTEDIVIPYVPGYIPRDKDGNPLKPVDPEDPTKGYVPPTLPTDPSQDTPINYTKITTSYVTVDPNGKEVPIPEYPTVEGNQPKKDIPGYDFVKTTTDKDGNVTHVYRKVVKTTTSFVDESGKPVSPNEEGSQPKKAIPGYEFVKTTTDKDGNVTHVYRKVVKTTTSFVDGNGNPVSPNEEGNQPKKAIPGYEFVKTTTDKDGNVTHVYRKVTPPTPQPTPAQPVPPTAVKEAEAKRELPNTGTEDNASLATLGLLGVLSGFGLVARKKKED